MIFRFALKSLTRRPLQSLLFTILLTAAIALMFVGLFAYSVSNRGFARAEEQYKTLVTIDYNGQFTDKDSRYASTTQRWNANGTIIGTMGYKDFFNSSELAPIVNSTYVKTANHTFDMPLISDSIGLTNAGKGMYYGRRFVGRVINIETKYIGDIEGYATDTYLLRIDLEVIYFFINIADKIVPLVYEDTLENVEKISNAVKMGGTYFLNNHITDIYKETVIFKDYYDFVKDLTDELGFVLSQLMWQTLPSDLTEIDLTGYEDDIGSHPFVTFQRENMEYIEEWPASVHHLSAMATKDIESLPIFHLGDVLLTDGQGFTAGTADKVCLISEALAKMNRLSIGNTINLALFKHGEFVPNEYSEYEIIGIFKPTSKEYRYPILYTGVEDKYFLDSSFKLPRTTEKYMLGLTYYDNTVIIPEASIYDVPEFVEYRDSHEYFRSDGIWAEDTISFMMNYSRDRADFLDELKSNGFDFEKYRLTFHDHGYENFKAGLSKIREGSVLLLCIAFLAAVTVEVFIIYIFILHRKRDTAVMMVLGTSKPKVIAVMTISLAVIFTTSAVAGILAGGLISFGISGIVESSIAGEAKYKVFTLSNTVLDKLQLDTPVAMEVYLIIIFGTLVLLLLCLTVVTYRTIKTEPVELLSGEKG